MHNWTWKQFLFLGMIAGAALVIFWWLLSNPTVKAEASFQCIPNNADCFNSSDHRCCAGLSCQNGPGNSHKCKPVATTTPSPTATLTPTPSIGITVTPTPSCIHVGDDSEFQIQDGDAVPCETPTPSPVPSETPEATPTATPVPEQHFSTPSGCSTNCGGEPPAQAVCTLPLKEAGVGTGKRISSDTVVFTWYPSTDSHDKQVLLYGPAADQLIYSVLDIPAGVSEYEVHGLTSGHYFAQVGTWKDSCIVWSKTFDP